jgi:hypothetical protein
MLITRLLSTSALLLTTLIPASAIALELTNGKTIFEKSPQLIEVATSSRKKNNPLATYHFIIEIPADAGEPLKAIEIEQRGNSRQDIIFKPKQSRAFLGNIHTDGNEQALSLESIRDQEYSQRKITVVFEEPIPPGNTVTVEIKPKSNPRLRGAYLFGVTAYPPGEDSQGLYLGSRQINITK